MMRGSTSSPNETSPLLSPSDHNVSRSDIDAQPTDGAVVGATNGDEIGDDVQDGGDGLERQENNDDPSSHQGIPEVKKRMKYIFPAIAIGVFLSAADQTLVVSTYSTIGTELHALSSASWIATAYFLTVAAFQPIYGKLSDIFGRKQCLLFAYTVFGLGSFCCGLARNMSELIAARAIAGVGGGGMVTVVIILLSDVVSLSERGTWQGYLNMVYALGAAAGAPLGGLLADSIGWRWAFLAQGPLCLIAFLTVALVLNLPQQDRSHWKQKVLKIDFIGATTLIVAVFALLTGLDHGSNVSWKSPITIAALCISSLFVVFVFVEKYVASHPIAPFRIIADRSLIACYACNFFSFAAWISSFFYAPLYWQVEGNLDAAHASALLVPGIFCSVCASVLTGFYMKRTGKYYWLTVIAYTSLFIGHGALLICSGLVIDSRVGMMVGLPIALIGNGIGVTTTLIAIIANALRTDQAVATACAFLFRSLGSVFGVSMCATAFNQTLRNSLRDALGDNKGAEDIAERVRQSLSYFRSLNPEMQSIVKSCYGQSARAALGVSMGLAVGSVLAAWFIKEKRLKD